jgi:colanic acid biosynthesis glycosyl transferase WcaI
VTASERRPRLLVFNQYYWPGVEATAQLLTELCEALADEYEVTVITGRLRGHEHDPDYERRNGVELIRVHSTAFDRAPLHRRAMNYFTYLTRALRRGLTVQRPDVVLCMTDPPMVGDVALAVAHRFRVPLVVVSQDVFPEIAVELKRLDNPLLVALLRVLTSFYLRRAERVVAIGETMEQRLIAKGTPPARISVIPNWVDTKTLVPRERDNDWAREQGLVGRFVVMHSGNIGHAQDLDTLVRSATFLRDLEQLEIVLIGFGARHADIVALADQLDVENIRFLEYQPRERLSDSLASADVHFVGLGQGLAGYVVPSRLYGIMAAGRPVIVAADDESETAGLVTRVGAGIVVSPGRPKVLAGAIRAAYGAELDLAEMGRRARGYATTEADRDIAIGRYRELLAGVRGELSSS